jgi:hypothetical protein
LRRIGIAAFAVASLFVVPSIASAATITPNVTTDDATLTNCTLRQAVTSIDTGIYVANCAAHATGTLGTTDTVALGSNTYQLTINVAGADDNNLEGDLDLFKPMSIVGTGSSSSAIQQTVGDERVLDETATGQNLSLSGLTIEGGTATGGGAGGGINFNGGGTVASLTLDHVVVTNNTNDGAIGAKGGGIYTNSPTTVTNSTITGNSIATATGNGNGGGIYQDAGNGPAFFAGVTLTVQHSSITNNSAANGNTLGLGSGGGIYRTTKVGDSTSTALIEDTAISDNVAKNFGGGMYTDSDSPLSINKSLINGNSALTQRGGGLQTGSRTATQGSLSLVNSTITGNSANGVGGGVEVGSAPSSPVNAVLLFDTFAANTAPGTGTDFAMSGLNGASRPTLTLQGNLIAGDSALNASNDCALDPSDPGNPPYFINVVNSGYNVTDTSTDLCGKGVGTGPGDHGGVLFPLVGALADHGGPTQTMIPTASSFATDLMPNGTCTAISPAVTTDQRGYPRPGSTGGNCDAGAYESLTCNGSLLNTPTPLCVPPSTGGGGAGSATGRRAAALKKCKKKRGKKRKKCLKKARRLPV